MVGGTWWAVSGGWYMVGSEWWVVHGGQCFRLLGLVNNVVVVIYVVNE